MRLPDLVELRGARRAEEISEAVRREEARERLELGGISAALDYGGWPSPHPVPEWAWRPLRAGEWRERVGGEGGKWCNVGVGLAETHLTLDLLESASSRTPQA